MGCIKQKYSRVYEAVCFQKLTIVLPLAQYTMAFSCKNVRAMLIGIVVGMLLLFMS